MPQKDDVEFLILIVGAIAAFGAIILMLFLLAKGLYQLFL